MLRCVPTTPKTFVVALVSASGRVMSKASAVMSNESVGAYLMPASYSWSRYGAMNWFTFAVPAGA